MTTTTVHNAAAPCRVCGQPFSFPVPQGTRSKIVDTLIAVRTVCGACSQAEIEADDRERAERKALNDAQELTRRIKGCGLPRNMPTEWDDRMGAAWTAAREWADGKTTSLLLVGPVGVGKTTIAATALRERLRARAGYWRSMPVLLAHLSLPFSHPLHEKALELLDGRYMLGLDDLSAGRPTDYVGQHVFAAIDSCWSMETPLIVTSNVGLDGIAEHWEDRGQAIASRLQDGVVIHMEGDDRRLRRTDG